jgi:hypothetical protein
VANDGCDGGSCCGVQGEAGGAGGSPAPSSTAVPYSPSTAREQLQRQATGERQPPRRPSGGGREGAVLGVSVRNVVPTLTSNKRQGLSLNGRC